MTNSMCVPVMENENLVAQSTIRNRTGDMEMATSKQTPAPHMTESVNHILSLISTHLQAKVLSKNQEVNKAQITRSFLYQMSRMCLCKMIDWRKSEPFY